MAAVVSFHSACRFFSQYTWDGTGKSTSITQLGKTFQIDLQRRWPANPDRIPVVYIVVPPDAGPKALATELAAFLGLPVHPHDGPQHVAHAAAEVLRRVGAGMVLVDEIQVGFGDLPARYLDAIPARFRRAGLLARPKWSRPEVRRGSDPGGRVAEVEAAGGVEGVFG